MEVEPRIKELKEAFAKFDKENDEIIASAEVKDGVLDVTNDRIKAFRANIAQMKAIQTELGPLEESVALKAWGAEPSSPSIALATAAGKAMFGGQQRKTLGQVFTESEMFQGFVKSGADKMDTPFPVNGIDLGAKWITPTEAKDIYTTLPTFTPGAYGFGPIQRDPIVEMAYRRVRVRDLFGVQNTNAAVIEYFRVTGFTNAASTVAERSGSAFALKPQSSLTFVGHQAPVRTIATWEAAHRNVLDDVPQLQGIIDTELLYGLRLEEDDQILNGTGSGNDLEGILGVAGVQTYSRPGSPPTNEQKADDVRRAMTKVMLSYYEPTGVVMHPTDWESIETIKTTQGAYIVAASVALGGEPRVWRLPVVDTPAIAAGTALIGAFGIGAQLYDRQQGQIRIADQHADFFVRNAIVLLAEERLALATKRPESFCKITFGA